MRPSAVILAAALATACHAGPEASPIDGSPADGSPTTHDAASPADARDATAPIFSVTPGSIMIFERIGYDDNDAAPAVAAGFWADRHPSLDDEWMRDGACRILGKTSAPFCDPPCDAGDRCVADNECRPWPIPRSVGIISLLGLKHEIRLLPGTPPIGGVGNYTNYRPDPSLPPDDIFDPEDAITASAPGEELPGFEITASAVPPVDGLQGTENAAGDLEISWTPVDPTARVRLLHGFNIPHHGMPTRYLECEGPDTGSLVIPRAIVEELTDVVGICGGGDCHFQHFGRYRRATETAGGQVIELLVGSARFAFIITA